jgi:hypothetical protein
LAALPFVVLDASVPSTRRFVSLPQCYPRAAAHYALGFFAWAQVTGDPSFVSRGVRLLVELDRTRCSDFEECCWGLPFDWESHVGTIGASTPMVTVVPYVYEALRPGHGDGKP